MSLTTGCLTGTTQMRVSAFPYRSAGMSAHSAAFFRGTRSLPFRPCKPLSQQWTSMRTQVTRALGDEGELLPDVEEGAKVRVTKEILVYHAPKTKEMQLQGKEGTVKTIVKHYKGKDTSANLPYRVEFMIEQEGGKQQKWFAHLAASEIEKIA